MSTLLNFGFVAEVNIAPIKVSGLPEGARIFDANDNLLDIDVLPFLRKINDYYSLGIDSKHPLGSPKNTQVFGKDIMH